MNLYRHINEGLDVNNRNTSAILSEIDIDESFSVEYTPRNQNYLSNTNKIKSFVFRRTVLERSLIVIISILLIALLFLIIPVLRNKSNSVLSSNVSTNLCLTPTCIQLSYELSSAINESVDPCENFYEFSCGRWIRSNVIPTGHSTWSVIKELNQRNMIILKNILEQTSLSSSLNSAELQTIKYYQSCMNIDEIERLHLEPLEKFLKLNLNLTLDQWKNIDRTNIWNKLFVDITKLFLIKYSFSFIFPIKIEPDEKNSTWNNIHIDQPQLVLENRDYYVNSSDNQINQRNQIIIETYRKVGADILQILHFEQDDSIQRMKNIIQLERELAIVSLPMEILQKPNETYSLMKLKELDQLYKPIGFDIYSFFNEMFNINSTNIIKFNENDQVIVLSIELMSKVTDILKDYLLTPNKSYIIIDYLLLSFVFYVNPYLSSIFEKTLLPLKKEVFGKNSIAERWEFCTKETDIKFGYGLGALYVNRAFSENDRLRANELIKSIRESFRENLMALSWIDEPTRTEAINKLNKIYQKIGYPDFIKNQTKLNAYYANYSMNRLEYFQNAIQVIEQDRRKDRLKFQQQVDRTEWHMTPQIVNAYYSPSNNQIVFPAGILQPPFFHKDLPLAINYGAIGTVIGHEMTHGFDNQGREFDADGNMRSWWTQFSVNNFQSKTQCFIDQYSSFMLDGQKENGLRTLGENIADNGGVKIAYNAYKKERQKVEHIGHDHLLPGLNFTNDQLFFITFAHSWCTIETENAMHFDLLNDPHSPARFRIIGTVQNNEDFSKAFNCKSNAFMNQNNKCQLW